MRETAEPLVTARPQSPVRTPIRTVIVLTALMAGIYAAIGTGLVEVIDDDPSGQATFGLTAAVFFGALTLVFWKVRRRLVWIAGLLVEVFVVVVYFDLASDREPAFEPWGIALRLIQVPLVLSLAYLSWRGPGDQPDAS